MTRKSKPISWRQESGIENVEWIALAAVLLVTLVVAGTTIEVGGQTVGARLVTQISCWVAGWQGEGSAACGAATAGGAGAGAAGVGAATGQPSTVAGLPQGSSLTDERGSMLTFLTTRSESALRSVGIGAEDRSSYVDLGASDALMGVYANSYDNPLVQDSAEMLGWRYNVYTGEFEKTDQPQEDLDPLEEMSRLADLCVAGTVPPQNCEFLFTGVFDPSFYVQGGPAMTSGSSGFRTNLLAVFSVVLALLAIFSFRQTSRDAPVALNWESLVPGQTTRVDLEGMLGKPAEVEVQDDMEWLRYPSGNTVLPHLFGFRNDILVMGDIHLDGTGISAEELGQRFGPPEKVAYSRFVRGARAFIWARQGVALIADWDTGRPYRIRRFESMSVEQFMGSWGRNLPESDPYRQ